MVHYWHPISEIRGEMQGGVFDTHAHYDSAAFDYIRHATLSGMPEFGVSLILNCGSDEESSAFSAELACVYPFVYSAAGIHPHESARAQEGWEERMSALLVLPKTVAVGEVGLDYYYDHSDRASQRDVFERSLSLALSLDMPVIVHDRDAHEDILSMLGEYRPKGVVHRFSGTPEMAEKLLGLGFYLGFGCAVTYPDANNERSTLKTIPFEKLLLETDCPYLPPFQQRTELCRSDMLAIAAEEISRIRPEYSPRQIVDIARENGKRLFSIP